MQLTVIPYAEFVSTMRLIVNKLRCADDAGGDKLIKYYLCLFQAALYRDNDAAFQILQEVKRMIDDGLGTQVCTVADNGVHCLQIRKQKRRWQLDND